MSIKVLFLVLSSVSLSALAQIMLKIGMSGDRVQKALDGSGPGLGLILGASHSPMVWLGMLAYFVGAIIWLLVLAKIDVSMAYPFVGLGFILTMLLGYFILGEGIGALRLVGTLLVVAGVVLISST